MCTKIDAHSSDNEDGGDGDDDAGIDFSKHNAGHGGDVMSAMLQMFVSGFYVYHRLRAASLLALSLLNCLRGESRR